MPTRRLLVINPNATEAMTIGIASIARSAAPAGCAIAAVTNASGPPAIEGPADGAAAVPGVLEAIRAHPDYDGYLIACFDDTGLDEARRVSEKPVVGIGEASFLAAAAHGPFCIVTTVAEAEPVITKNVRASEAASRCKSVKAAGISVLDLEYRMDEAAPKVSAEINRQCSIHGVSTVILGCAGMGGVQSRIAERVRAALIEPVAAGVALLHERAS